VIATNPYPPHHRVLVIDFVYNGELHNTTLSSTPMFRHCPRASLSRRSPLEMAPTSRKLGVRPSRNPNHDRTDIATDKVKIHYVGTLLDGTVFDSSRKRYVCFCLCSSVSLIFPSIVSDDPFITAIGVGKVIKGWDEGEWPYSFRRPLGFISLQASRNCRSVKWRS
jgi:hypothetical protein